MEFSPWATRLVQASIGWRSSGPLISIRMAQASQSIGSARQAAKQANAHHIALRIERENAVIAEKIGDLAQALESMKAAAALQIELDRGSKAHLLRHLQTLAEQGSAADRESPGYSMGVRRKLAV